jgi:hypothetical protein
LRISGLWKDRKRKACVVMEKMFKIGLRVKKSQELGEYVEEKKRIEKSGNVPNL